MRIRTLLELGRVSNLPTVWSNALAGIAFSGWLPSDATGIARFACLALAASLLYIAGMVLNDAFDAEIDAQARADRPIPRGDARRADVFRLGFGLLLVGVAVGFALGTRPGLAGLALAVTVLLYDATHKRSTLAPWLMGLCRVLVYWMAALAVPTTASSISLPLLWGGAGLLALVAGVTYAARQEAYDQLASLWPLLLLATPVAIGGLRAKEAGLPTVGWLVLFGAWLVVAVRGFFRRAPGDVSRAVARLIAGIALFDSVMISSAGAEPLAMMAFVAFLATLALQTRIAGT